MAVGQEADGKCTDANAVLKACERDYLAFLEHQGRLQELQKMKTEGKRPKAELGICSQCFDRRTMHDAEHDVHHHDESKRVSVHDPPFASRVSRRQDLDVVDEECQIHRAQKQEEADLDRAWSPLSMSKLFRIPPLYATAVQAYSCIALWMFLSCSVILFNKWLLAYTPFRFPIALTLWHMVFCSTLGTVLVRGFRVADTVNMTTKQYCTRVMPIGALYAASLVLSNSAYLTLSVSLIQMTKSLMPGLVYLAGVLAGRELFRLSTLATMALIAVGVAVAAFGEVSFDTAGAAMQLGALVVEASRLMLVQVLIDAKGCKMNSLQSLYYISPACALFLLPAFLILELPGLSASLSSLEAHGMGPVLVLNACAAFALNLAVFLLIGKTSALTMNVAGVIKDWVLIACSQKFFMSPFTVMNAEGYAIALVGVALYQYGKLQKLQQDKLIEERRALENKLLYSKPQTPFGGDSARGESPMGTVARRRSRF